MQHRDAPEQTTEPKDATYGGFEKCLSYDRYVEKLEKKKQRACRANRRWLWWCFAAGVVIGATVAIILLCK